MNDSHNIEAAIQHIVDSVPDLVAPSDFQDICTNVFANPTLSRILGESDEALKEKIKKLAYARRMLQPEIYKEIWEEWLQHEGMTFDKICTIAVGEHTLDVADGLPLEFVRAIWGKYLAHPWMTADKITLIVFGTTLEYLEDTWGQRMAEMTQAELNAMIIATFPK